jgi:hypothetical protein
MKNIPKICHLYWDTSPMSWLQTITINSFHRYNPDWKIIVYIPKKRYSGNQSFIPNYTGTDYFNLIENLNYVEIKIIDLSEYDINENLHDILRSDIFRYKILYEIGGIWSDFDVIWLKPIHEILQMDYLHNENIEHMTDTVCMFQHTTGHHNISVMIHKNNTEFIESLINKTNEIQKTLPKMEIGHQTFGTVMINVMYPAFSDIRKRFPNVIPLKYETIFPYSIFHMEGLYNIKDLTKINENVLCVHWFNGHILSKKYVNNGDYNQNCSMTEILKNEKWI